MNLQKRLASKILKVGKSKIWLDPTKIKEIEEAVTSADIRRLIMKGYIKAFKEKPRILREKKKRKGPGRRKGKKYAKISRKTIWIKKVRAQRKLLKELKRKNMIEKSAYRKLYRLVKGGVFRSRAHLLLYAKQHGLVKNETA